MVNKKFVAIVLAVGLLLSIGVVVSSGTAITSLATAHGATLAGSSLHDITSLDIQGATLAGSGTSSGSSDHTSGPSDHTSGPSDHTSDHWQMGPEDYWQTGSWSWSTPVTTYPSTYQNPVNNNLNFWMEGHKQYAILQQYSHISLIASTLLGGQGVVYELYPITTGQGTYSTNTYNFNPGDNPLEFAGDIVGRHLLFFSINNQASNAVIVDVQGGINPLQQQSNGPILGQGAGGSA